MTADRLIYVQLQFGSEMYHFTEDLARHSQGTAKVTAAWTRRLKDVAKLSIGRFGGRIDGPRDSFPIGDVSLVFTDGEDVDLRVDQFALNTDDDRADRFVSAVRAGAGL